MNNNDEIININNENDINDPSLNPNNAPSDDGSIDVYVEGENEIYDSISTEQIRQDLHEVEIAGPNGEKPITYKGNTADAAKKAYNDATIFAYQENGYNHSIIYNRINPVYPSAFPTDGSLKDIVRVAYAFNYEKITVNDIQIQARLMSDLDKYKKTTTDSKMIEAYKSAWIDTINSILDLSIKQGLVLRDQAIEKYNKALAEVERLNKANDQQNNEKIQQRNKEVPQTLPKQETETIQEPTIKGPINVREQQTKELLRKMFIEEGMTYREKTEPVKIELTTEETTLKASQYYLYYTDGQQATSETVPAGTLVVDGRYAITEEELENNFIPYKDEEGNIVNGVFVRLETVLVLKNPFGEDIINTSTGRVEDARAKGDKDCFIVYSKESDMYGYDIYTEEQLNKLYVPIEDEYRKKKPM